VEAICSLIVLHHDIGKLTNEYQNEAFYRHEMLSACFLYKYIIECGEKMGLSSYECAFLAPVAASVAYLHHEGLQVSHRHLEMRAPTYSYLLGLLWNKSFSMVTGWESIASKLEDLELGSHYTYPSFVDGLEVASTLGKIITYSDGAPKPLALRMAIASALQPVVICDNRAARYRGGRTTRFSEFLGAGEL
jgi:hypothetical protein